MAGPLLSPYVRAQLAGWGGFAALRFVGVLAEKPFYEACERLPHVSIKTAVACAASFLLGAIYSRRIGERSSLRQAALLVVPLSLAGGIAVELLYQGIGVFTFPDEPVMFLPKEMLNQGVILLAWSAVWVGISTRRELEQERERALVADALAADARLQMLRYQVHPHFLFNALNALRALVESDPPGARRMVTQLAEFFRYSLLHTRKDWARLGDEIEAVRNYLAIQTTRFDDRLKVSIDSDPEASPLKVPAFLLHTLVENAVKYGMETSPMPLTIEIRTRVEGEEVEIRVENTGRWVEPGTGSADNGTGTGLANARHRLALLLPGRHRFEVGGKDGRVVAILRIPAERGS